MPDSEDRFLFPGSLDELHTARKDSYQIAELNYLRTEDWLDSVEAVEDALRDACTEKGYAGVIRFSLLATVDLGKFGSRARVGVGGLLTTHSGLEIICYVGAGLPVRRL